MKNYEINRQTLAIIPCGTERSKIIEENNEFFINQPPTKIIDNSCRFFGSSYDGRLNGTKNILGVSHKAPIIIEESSGIIFFPTTSPRLESCAWISLNNIAEYYKLYGDTIIKFNCGKKIKLELSYGIIDNQVLRATRLESLITKRVCNLKNN